jgi:hypothetical protein
LGLDSRKVQIADGAAGIPPILPFSLCDDSALLLTSPGNLFGGARLSLGSCWRSQGGPTPVLHRGIKPMKTIATLLAAAALTLAASSADAKGCLKGAAVGGVAGHYAGHHGVLGAIAGCAYGHHRAKEQAREQQEQQNHPGQTPADNNKL